MKHSGYIFLILSMVLIYNTHASAKPNKASKSAKKVQKVFKKYLQAHDALIQIKATDKKITFNEKSYTAILESNAVSQKKFHAKVKGSAGLKASVSDYLASQKFKRIKECLSFGSDQELTAVTWKKGRTYIHYVFSYTTEAKTYDQLDTITFFARSLCGK